MSSLNHQMRRYTGPCIGRGSHSLHNAHVSVVHSENSHKVRQVDELARRVSERVAHEDERIIARVRPVAGGNRVAFI